MPEMMKPAKTAAELNISTETLRMYAEEGRIPFVSTPGGHRRYLLEDVKHALLMEKAMKLEELKVRRAEDPSGHWCSSYTHQAGAPLAGLPAQHDHRRRSRGKTKQAVLQIPFIGKPGTSRFVAGQGVHA